MEPRSPNFYDFCESSNKYMLVFMLLYGWQKPCFGSEGKHSDDEERVYVLYSKSKGRVTKVKFHQHNGWYMKSPEIEEGRSVVYVRKVAHRSYHFGCDDCIGGCGN